MANTSYVIKSGDTLSQIAAANNTDIKTIQGLNPSITDPNKISAGATLNLPGQNVPSNLGTGGGKAPAGMEYGPSGQLQPISTTPAPTTVPTPPAITPITNPITPPSTSTTGTPAPVLPTPTAPVAQGAYLQGAQSAADTAQATLQAKYDQEVKDLQTQIDASKAKIDGYNELESNDIMTNIKTLTAPFQAQYESDQESLLSVNENFQANQQLTEELSNLLDQGNAIIAQTKGLPVASTVLNSMVNKTMSDVAARASVIQAVMAARNSQISVAENMIDRGVAAINADRKDQLDYYNTLMTLTESKKGDEQKNLLSLTSDQKTYVQAQIASLQSKADQTQKNADALKTAMQDPDTALAYGQAGVTLNDNPAQVNAKLATYAYSKELSDLSQKMASAGYTALVGSQKAPAGMQTVTVQDSKGVSHSYYTQAKATANTAADQKAQEQADIASMSSSLHTKLGPDGYINPKDWLYAKQQWVSGGYSAADYDAIFGVYKNPNDTYN